MPPWTTDDIPDLSGRTAVVTGANSGLGFESALALTRAGAEVVLACRDQTKGAEAADRITGLVPSATVSLVPLDLSDLSSVRAFAAVIGERYAGLDILLNNAGVMAIPRRETADGFEMQFGTNHLGHFALTGLLLDSLLARPGARVVTVSSAVAQVGRIRFDDLQGTAKYGKWSAYSQSKLANQLFTLELDRRASRAGLDLVSVAAHPGYAATNLQAVGPQMKRLEPHGADDRPREQALRAVGGRWRTAQPLRGHRTGRVRRPVLRSGRLHGPAGGTDGGVVREGGQ